MMLMMLMLLMLLVVVVVNDTPRFKALCGVLLLSLLLLYIYIYDFGTFVATAYHSQALNGK